MTGQVEAIERIEIETCANPPSLNEQLLTSAFCPKVLEIRKTNMRQYIKKNYFEYIQNLYNIYTNPPIQKCLSKIFKANFSKQL